MTTNPHSLSSVEKRILAVASPELCAQDIALAAYVTAQDVYRCVKKYGVEIRRFKIELTTEQEEQIRAMASPETGLKEISETVGCTRYQAKCFLEEEGLPRRRSKSLRKEIQMDQNGIFNVDGIGKRNTWLV